MLLDNAVPVHPKQSIKESPTKAKPSRKDTSTRRESQRKLLSKHNQEQSPDELNFPARSPSFKSAMQSPDPIGAYTNSIYTSPTSLIGVQEKEEQPRRSTFSDTQGRIPKHVEPIPRSNTVPSSTMGSRLISLSPLPVLAIYPLLHEVGKPNSPLLDQSFPICSSNDPTLIELEKGEFQLEHPVSIKTMEENWGINIVRSLNSQSNIPSTQKQESSDNAEILDTNGNEKCHIEPIDVTLFLSESIECVQETNFNINTVNCGINTRQSLNSNARSRLSDPEMPTSLVGKKVSISETDSEGAKSYYQHTFGPDSYKMVVHQDTEDESERSVVQLLSKEIRDRYVADSFENISVYSSVTSDLIGNKSLSPIIPLPQKEVGTAINNKCSSLPDISNDLNVDKYMSPCIPLSPDEIGLSIKNTKGTSLPDTSTIVSDTHSIAPDTNPIVQTYSVGSGFEFRSAYSNTDPIHSDTTVTVPDSNTNAPNPDGGYPDILESNATKPDIISHVTHLPPEPMQDGPSNPNLGSRDFIVNYITRTIHSYIPDSNVGTLDTTNFDSSLELMDSYISPQNPDSEKYNTNLSVNSDLSVAYQGIIPGIITESDHNSSPSFSDINVNEGLGPHHMYRGFVVPNTMDSYGSSENESTSYKSDSISIPDAQSIQSNSPLSLYEEWATLDPQIDYTALLREILSPSEQQQQQHVNLDNTSDFSMILQNPLQLQNTEITPTSSLQPVLISGKTAECSSIGHISGSLETGDNFLTQSLPTNDHDTIISEASTTDLLIRAEPRHHIWPHLVGSALGLSTIFLVPHDRYRSKPF